MLSTLAIEVNASPEVVFWLSRDVTRWDLLLPHYSRARAVRREPDGSLVVDFIARRAFIPLLGVGLPVAWRARTWNEPSSRELRFVHVAGVTKGMDVTWRIEPTPSGTRVSIDHAFAPAAPGLAWFVDRFFTRPIAGRTLSTFKALAEALDKSGGPASTNPLP